LRKTLRKVCHTMIDPAQYKIHPEAFKIMKEAIHKGINERVTVNEKVDLACDRAFIHLFLYARRIGNDKEHVEYLTRNLSFDTLELTELLGAIDKYQKEIGL